MSVLWVAHGILEIIAAAQSSATATVGGDLDVGRELGSYRAGAGVGGELRATGGAGEVLGGSVTVRGGLYPYEVMEEEGVALAPARFESTIELAALPALSARRDRRRRPYDRTSTTAWFEFIRVRSGSITGGAMPLELTVSHDVQVDGDRIYRRDEVRVGFSALRYCGVGAGAPPRWCLSIVGLQLVSAYGALSVTGGRFAPVALDHLAVGDWTVDAQVAVGGGRIDLPGVAPPVEPDDAQEQGCDDRGTCVLMHTPVYDLWARGPSGAVALDLRAVRSTYPTMTGELVVEDRAEATASWAHRRTTFTGHAFTAYSQWWTLDGRRFARVGDDVTGGADLTASRDLRGWQLDLSMAAARSYHGAHDGGAPRAELAVQGMAALRRDWRLER